MKKLGIETIFGGVFGIIAIVAAYLELQANEFTTSAIFGCVKDVSGTIVVVMVFLFAVRSFIPKKLTGFQETFDSEIINVENKYFPIIKKAELDDSKSKNSNNLIRYELSTDLDSFFNENIGAYKRVFEFKKGTINRVDFFVSKSVFKGRSEESFADEQNAISHSFKNRIEKNFSTIKNVEITEEGFSLIFIEPLKSSLDAKNLVEIIEYIILLYMARYKK